MPPAYWYYGLAVVSLALLALSLLHRKDWKLVVLHLSLFSIIHPFEIAVMLNDAYRYWPGVWNTMADNYLGAYISDLFFVPSLAVVISAFSLSWRSVLCIAAFLSGVDWYFNEIGIYSHYWWKSIYTGLGLLVLYAISGWLWKMLQKKRTALLFRLLIIHLTFFAMQSAINFAANRGGQLYKLQLAALQLDSPEKMQAVLVSLYQLVISLIIVICVGLRLPWRWRFLGIIAIVALNWSIGYFGLFLSQAAITPYHLILIPAVVVTLLTILFRAAKLDYLFP